MHDSVTQDAPIGDSLETVWYVAATLRYMGLHDLADTLIEGDVEGALMRTTALRLGWQSAALAEFLRRR